MADKSMQGYSKPENADARFSPGASIGQTIAIGQPDTGNPWKDPEPVAPHGSGQTHPKMPFARPPNKQVTRGGPGSGPRKGGSDHLKDNHEYHALSMKEKVKYHAATSKASGSAAEKHKTAMKAAKERTDFGGETRGGPGSGPRKGGGKSGGSSKGGKGGADEAAQKLTNKLHSQMGDDIGDKAELKQQMSDAIKKDGATPSAKDMKNIMDEDGSPGREAAAKKFPHLDKVISQFD